MAKSRKELIKGPDEFITLTGKLIRWARNNTKPLIIGTCAFFVLIALISVYRIYNTQRERSAAVLLSQNLTAYLEARNLENNSDKALATVRPEFERLIAEYGGQPAGRAGRLLLAHVALSGHASDEAIALYRKALSDFSGDPSLHNILRNGLATAYMQKGDQGAAIEHFQAVATGKSVLLKDAALFHLGYLYSTLGEAEKSRQAYLQLKSDFPDSMYSDIAREKAAG
jgi:predicted negative regulator of RcsB-dependent stress response